MSPGHDRRPTSVTDGLSCTTVVLCRGEIEVASWPLEQHDRVGLATVDQLARLQLVARRLGFTVRLRHAGVELSRLLDLAGLTAVVPVTGAARASGELCGQPEGGEELGVEEVVVTDDPVS